MHIFSYFEMIMSGSLGGEWEVKYNMDERFTTWINECSIIVFQVHGV